MTSPFGILICQMPFISSQISITYVFEHGNFPEIFAKDFLQGLKGYFKNELQGTFRELTGRYLKVTLRRGLKGYLKVTLRRGSRGGRTLRSP